MKRWLYRHTLRKTLFCTAHIYINYHDVWLIDLTSLRSPFVLLSIFNASFFFSSRNLLSNPCYFTPILLLTDHPPTVGFFKFNSLRILYSCQCSRLSSDLHMLSYFSALYHRLSQTSHEHFVLLPKVFWSRNLRFPRRWLTVALNPDM